MVEQEDLLKLKKNQRLLRSQISGLEGRFKDKYKPGLQQDSELQDIVFASLRQNTKLAERVENLIDVLIDALGEIGNEPMEKMLTTLARSQIDMMDQIANIQEKLTKVQGMDELKKMEIDSTAHISKKIEEISSIISQLPRSKQIETIGKDIDMLEQELKELEAKLSTGPSDLKTSIDLIKKDIRQLSIQLGGISKELLEIEEREEKFAEITPSIAAVGSLQGKISSLESKIDLIAASLKTVPKPDLNALKVVTDKIAGLEQEIKKLEKYIETYPVGDAQQLSYIKQELMEIEKAMGELKHKPTQESIANELEKLKDKFVNLQKQIKVKGFNDQKKTSEINLILEILDSIDRELSILDSKEQRPDLKTEIRELRKNVSDTRKKLSKSRNKEVKPEKVAEIHEIAKNVRQDIDRGEIDSSKGFAMKKHSEDLELGQKQKIEEYIDSLASGRRIKISDISKLFEMNYETTKKILLEIKDEKNIRLENLGFGSKMFGKDAIVVKG